MSGILLVRTPGQGCITMSLDVTETQQHDGNFGRLSSVLKLLLWVLFD